MNCFSKAVSQEVKGAEHSHADAVASRKYSDWPPRPITLVTRAMNANTFVLRHHLAHRLRG